MMKTNRLVNNAALDALRAVLAGAGGDIVLKCYDGEPPATADGSYVANNLLATFQVTGASIAFDASADSQLLLTSGQTIQATTAAGSPTHAVLCRADDAMGALTPGAAGWPRIIFGIPSDLVISNLPWPGSTNEQLLYLRIGIPE